MEQLQKLAKIAFCSEFTFYLKAHFFHWNIEGPDFLQYHDLFGKIYEEVFESIDPFAERIRTLKTYVPGSHSRFNMLSQIDDETEVLSKDFMVKELHEDNEKMIVILKKLFKTAEEFGEHGFSDFIAQRIDAHNKHGWMLRASMKKDQL
jgi:starvation-inducible DNA-binding protein